MRHIFENLMTQPLLARFFKHTSEEAKGTPQAHEIGPGEVYEYGHSESIALQPLKKGRAYDISDKHLIGQGQEQIMKALNAQILASNNGKAVTAHPPEESPEDPFKVLQEIYKAQLRTSDYSTPNPYFTEKDDSTPNPYFTEKEAPRFSR